MPRAELVVAVLCILAACSPGRARRERVGPAPVAVVLISFDGFRHDYIERPAARVLRALATRGVRARALVPVFPSKTFPNHYSMVTGLHPTRHGIVGNDMYDPVRDATFGLADRAAVRDAEWWQGEPIWVTVERRGQPTAPFFWPGSEAPIGGRMPTYSLRYRGAMSHEVRIDTLLTLLALPPQRRPRFLTMYFSDTDDAGHDFGPASVEVDSAIARLDAALGRLLDGLIRLSLGDSVAVVVVSDHGMAPLSPDRVIRVDSLAGARVTGWSPVLGLWPAPDSVATLVTRLRNRHPALSVYRRESTPDGWRYRAGPRVPPVVALAAEGWIIAGPDRPPDWVPHSGDHGYDPALESQWGILVAAGPGIRKASRLPAIGNPHVHQLLAHLLGVRPPPADGSIDSVRDALE